MVATLAVAVLLAAAVAFTAVAVAGLYRLPDVYARAHATSKIETLGALCSLAAAAVAYADADATLKLGALSVFLLATVPTATHAIVRSADQRGVDPWTRDDGGDDS